MPRETPDDSQRPGDAPWEGEQHLTEATLAHEYPEVLSTGKWDDKAAGGPPPGPREFWIAEQFGCRKPKSPSRFAMAMYARKGLTTRPNHYVAAWRQSGHDQKKQTWKFMEFDEKSKSYKRPPPDGFVVWRKHGLYRVIWLGDDAVDGRDTASYSAHDRRGVPRRDDGRGGGSITGSHSGNLPPPQVYIASEREINTILHGPPGTGKTYAALRRCVALCDQVPDDSLEEDIRVRRKELVAQGRVEFVTFHQSYGYEEFVEGLRPDKKAGFSLTHENGILKRIAQRAREDLSQPFVLVIDEINRANVSKVMGELITLLEHDKRGDAPNEVIVTLPHSEERFSLPRNLHILGTMNTADRSIALLDTALRRRFRFEQLPPKPQLLESVAPESGVDLPKVLAAINERLEWLLDEDHLIGHAWFMHAHTRDDVDDIMRHKIIPLIKEYFYDDRKKVQEVLGGDDNGFMEKIEPKRARGSGYARHRWVERGKFDGDAYTRLISRTNADETPR